MLAQLGDYDFVTWGWNTDWPALFQPGPGLPELTLMELAGGPTFQALDYQRSTIQTSLLGLKGSAGTPCYSITPTGARALLDACLPIGDMGAMFTANRKRRWRNTGIDVEMSRHYGSLRAFACFPPLAISPNDWHESSIQKGGANLN